MSNPENNWRGNDDAPQAAKYRWQEANSGNTGAAMPKSRLRWRLVAFAGAFLALFGWMLLIVLRTPPVTPLIVVSATDYDQRMPPNSWAADDIAALKSLDRNSVEFHQVRFDQRSDDAMQRLRNSLDMAAARPGNALVLHITMHGAVNGKGVPCLIPADADPMNSATWIEFSRILDEANRTAELKAKHKLIVVDGIRRLENWDMGLPLNSFVARVQEQFTNDHSRMANTAVLLATGVNQPAWSSTEMQGSVFGRFLSLGLAGIADESAVGGNGDQHVSLIELEQFLKDRVNEWAVQNRGCRQIPLLLYRGDDFTVTASLNAATRRRMLAAVRTPSGEQHAVSTSQLEKAWRGWQFIRWRTVEFLSYGDS